MRRSSKLDRNLNKKIIMYSGTGLGILAIVVIAILIYCKSLNDEIKDGTLTSEQIASIVNSTNSIENTSKVENTESASSEIGKNVTEAKNELKTNNTVINNTEKNDDKSNKNVLNTNNVSASSKNQNTVKNEKTEESTKNTEKNVELSFVKPVDGDITRDFAVENLIYSETLKEWTTHTGIDIKADKTTVVKAAEAGTVKTIKNDPRYGLTIVVEHANGFQTVYSNLLTSEFVVEGEKVEKGQSLGTVGNTAAFEIADEPHLHFEIIKDAIQVDPNIYLK